MAGSDSSSSPAWSGEGDGPDRWGPPVGGKEGEKGDRAGRERKLGRAGWAARVRKERGEGEGEGEGEGKVGLGQKRERRGIGKERGLD
jgi:hypothetical protein